MIEGIGVIESIDEKTKTIKTSNRLDGYGMKWIGWSIPGRALVNEALTESWLITNYDNGQWKVKSDEDITPKISQTEGSPSKYIYVGEVNVGDEVMVPAQASVTRSPNGYSLRGTAPFEFTDSQGNVTKMTTEMLTEQG